MNNTQRGIECSLYNGSISELLLFLSRMPFSFFVQHCSKIDNNQQRLPRLSNNYYADSQAVEAMAESCIWELVLQMYPIGACASQIETYDDFRNSQCCCCLIFYDCGLLDIYIKDRGLFERIWNKLLLLHAEDMDVISFSNDNRLALHL